MPAKLLILSPAVMPDEPDEAVPVAATAALTAMIATTTAPKNCRIALLLRAGSERSRECSSSTPEPVGERRRTFSPDAARGLTHNQCRTVRDTWHETADLEQRGCRARDQRRDRPEPLASGA